MRAPRTLTSLSALVLVVAACGGDTSPTTTAPDPVPASTTTSEPPVPPPSTTTGAPTTTVATTAATTTTEGPVPTSDRFAFLETTAVVGPSADRVYTNPGAVVEHAGELHMFRNSFSNWPGRSETTYLTSPDGIEWSEAADAPVLQTSDVPFAQANVFIMSMLVDEAGTWIAFFDTFNGQSSPGHIGRATATDPSGPWQVDESPVLEPDPEGGFDERRVAEPSVVRVGDDLWMFYTGFDAAGNGAIGLAVSQDDGASWTKMPDPVLSAPAWAASGSITTPLVAPADDGWVMLFTDPAGFAVGSARSSDGAIWQDDPGGPILRSLDVPGEEEIYQAELTRVGDRYFWWLEVGPGAVMTEIYALEFLVD